MGVTQPCSLFMLCPLHLDRSVSESCSATQRCSLKQGMWAILKDPKKSIGCVGKKLSPMYVYFIWLPIKVLRAAPPKKRTHGKVHATSQDSWDPGVPDRQEKCDRSHKSLFSKKQKWTCKPKYQPSGQGGTRFLFLVLIGFHLNPHPHPFPVQCVISIFVPCWSPRMTPPFSTLTF